MYVLVVPNSNQLLLLYVFNHPPLHPVTTGSVGSAGHWSLKRESLVIIEANSFCYM